MGRAGARPMWSGPILRGLGDPHDHLPRQQMERVQVFLIEELQHVPLHPLRVEVADLPDDLPGRTDQPPLLPEGGGASSPGRSTMPTYSGSAGPHVKGQEA